MFFRFENNNVKTQLSYYNPRNFSTTHQRYQVSGIQRSDRYVVNLEMTEVVKEDASEHQCAIQRAGNVEKGSQHIHLEMIQTAPIEYPKCDAYVQNDMLHLSCESTDSSPRPDLVWFHNGVEVSRRTDLRYSLTLNDLIMNLTDIDGTYECRFYYIGGRVNDERSCRIEKPNITVISPVNTEFINGSDAKITVLARASPPMTTTLLCEGDHDINVGGFSVQTDGNNLAHISILNIDFTMNGSRIMCCGRNFIGESCKPIFVFVKEYVPKRNEPPVVSNKDLDQGATTVVSNKDLDQGAAICQVAAPCSDLDWIELVVIVILVGAVVLLTAIIFFLCKKGKKKSRSSDNIPFETEIRSASFTSSSAGSQNSNADSGVNLQEASCLLKRSATVPAPRRLPAPPQSSLSQVREFDGTSRNETYSIIKNDHPPYLKESTLQPYMDMGGKKKLDKTSPTYSDELVPYDNSTAGDGFSSSHDDAHPKDLGKDGFSECSSRVTDSTEKVGYLEVKKDPNSQCQYQDLEDLYRETASNNLYAP